MNFHDQAITILHVEDDPDLALVVKMAFDEFGFRGELINLSNVRETLELLNQRERGRQSIHLILVDIKLPDGTGIDVIRSVKGNARWHLTPVIVLSNDPDTEIVNSAYALGAGCFLSKLPHTNSILDTLHGLYKCWLDGALWPQAPTLDRFQSAIARGVKLRARTGDLFLSAARACSESSDIRFWLELSMNEGNMSNLFAFIWPFINEKDAPSGLIDRLIEMQLKIEISLQHAQSRFEPSISRGKAELCFAALEVTRAFDPTVIAEVLKCLFRLTPQAITALRQHAATQLNALSSYVLQNTDERELVDQARDLQTWANSLHE